MQKSTTFSKYRLLRHQLFILRSAEWPNIQDMILQRHLVVNLITNNPSSVKNITKRLNINHFAHFKCWQNARSGSNLFIFSKYYLTVLSTGHFEKRGVAQTYLFSKVCFRVQFTGHFEWRREEQTFLIFKIVL